MSGASLTPGAGGVLGVTPKRADQLRTGDLLWRDETQRWHEVFVLPTQPVAVPGLGGMEICTNLHLVPNPKGPQSIATYTLPTSQLVLTAVPPISSEYVHPRFGKRATVLSRGEGAGGHRRVIARLPGGEVMDCSEEFFDATYVPAHETHVPGIPAPAAQERR